MSENRPGYAVRPVAGGENTQAMMMMDGRDSVGAY